jgi:class 3 adenylate cyclase
MEKAEHIERRLAAILSADVRGYSRMMAKDDVATVGEVKRCREIIDAHVREHHGRIVDSPGDNILAEFPAGRDR